MFGFGIWSAVDFQQCNVFVCKDVDEMVSCYTTSSGDLDCDMTPIKYHSCDEYSQITYAELQCVQPTLINNATVFYKPKKGHHYDGYSGYLTEVIAALCIAVGFVVSVIGIGAWGWGVAKPCTICILETPVE
jgi:hypothetical protein